ncbi:MAG: DUF4166 domain-containing protein [Alphaproteobacteria bacterium]|nr:DUF4166 domain-containing protein [Alphaproteobacteria bacterium]
MADTVFGGAENRPGSSHPIPGSTWAGLADRPDMPPPKARRNERGRQLPECQARAPGPFEQLLDRRDWLRLPIEVRRRFSTAHEGSEPRVYTGRVIATRLNRAGLVLARLARLFSTPLPDTDGAVGPASVSIATNDKLGGQIWTRVYGRPGRFPQVVHSVKRFCGPTGLEEFVGPGATWGIGMTLRLSVEGRVLVFRSQRYFAQIGPVRLTLPAWCEPGRMTIRHRQRSGSEFGFTLDLKHRWFGALIHQDCIFSDCRVCE